MAAEVGTAPPDVVVLTPGTDASVHDETLLLGLVRRRRALTLGLALLSLVDTAQLRAVLAHEHGHYAAGDTPLSALTYRTRAAVERAAAEMGPGLLGRVFGWYRERHVRLTEASGRSGARRRRPVRPGRRPRRGRRGAARQRREQRAVPGVPRRARRFGARFETRRLGAWRVRLSTPAGR